MDTSAACDLADDLRDAIVEYQVGPSINTYIHDGLLTQYAVRSAEGHVRTELQVNCKLPNPRLKIRRTLIDLYRRKVRRVSISDWHVLMAQ